MRGSSGDEEAFHDVLAVWLRGRRCLQPSVWPDVGRIPAVVGWVGAMRHVLVRGVATAPITFAWLLVLFITTRIQRSAGRLGARRIRRTHSTNLHRLRNEPARVRATSLLWLDDHKWWPYVPLFVGIVGPAERR